jgi:hypothetical protein
MAFSKIRKNYPIKCACGGPIELVAGDTYLVAEMALNFACPWCFFPKTGKE